MTNCPPTPAAGARGRWGIAGLNSTNAVAAMPARVRRSPRRSVPPERARAARRSATVSVRRRLDRRLARPLPRRQARWRTALALGLSGCGKDRCSLLADVGTRITAVICPSGPTSATRVGVQRLAGGVAAAATSSSGPASRAIAASSPGASAAVANSAAGATATSTSVADVGKSSAAGEVGRRAGQVHGRRSPAGSNSLALASIQPVGDGGALGSLEISATTSGCSMPSVSGAISPLSAPCPEGRHRNRRHRREHSRIDGPARIPPTTRSVAAAAPRVGVHGSWRHDARPRRSPG